jgi:hypothetical protein
MAISHPRHTLSTEGSNARQSVARSGGDGQQSACRPFEPLWMRYRCRGDDGAEVIPKMRPGDFTRALAVAGSVPGATKSRR